MSTRKQVPLDDYVQPETLAELHRFVRDHLDLSAVQEQALLAAIDAVFLRHEHLWQQSKHEAIQAISSGFADRMHHMREELAARESTVSSIARYFEQIVADLTDRVHRDPKTRLMNFRRFIERLEAFLAIEQRGRWCAVGLADITSFKSFNDTFGHALGDRIIDRVARLLREQIRSNDLMAQESSGGSDGQELHARFGGDEFCFLIPDLAHFHDAWIIAERFREAVELHDWTIDDARLADRGVNVDVGVVCLVLGPVSDRHPIARQLAHDLLARADAAMYQAKAEQAHHVFPVRVRLAEGVLVELGADEEAIQVEG